MMRQREDQDCTCCKGWTGWPMLCCNCTVLIHRTRQDWVRFDIMHQDRIGEGTLVACSIMCALVTLAQREHARRTSESSDIAYRGEGYVRMPGCDMRAHYAQLQAMCDALGYAAQKLQSESAERTERAYRQAGMRLARLQQRDAYAAADEAISHRLKANYWYGVFQGLRGLLRALEGNTGELHEYEKEMLLRINWDADPPHFTVPGFEHVKLEDQYVPGAEHAET